MGACGGRERLSPTCALLLENISDAFRKGVLDLAAFEALAQEVSTANEPVPNDAAGVLKAVFKLASQAKADKRPCALEVFDLCSAALLAPEVSCRKVVAEFVAPQLLPKLLQLLGPAKKKQPPKKSAESKGISEKDVRQRLLCEVLGLWLDAAPQTDVTAIRLVKDGRARLDSVGSGEALIKATPAKVANHSAQAWLRTATDRAAEPRIVATVVRAAAAEAHLGPLLVLSAQAAFGDEETSAASKICFEALVEGVLRTFGSSLRKQMGAALAASAQTLPALKASPSRLEPSDAARDLEKIVRAMLEDLQQHWKRQPLGGLVVVCDVIQSLQGMQDAGGSTQPGAPSPVARRGAPQLALQKADNESEDSSDSENEAMNRLQTGGAGSPMLPMGERCAFELLRRSLPASLPKQAPKVHQAWIKHVLPLVFAAIAKDGESCKEMKKELVEEIQKVASKLRPVSRTTIRELAKHAKHLDLANFRNRSFFQRQVCRDVEILAIVPDTASAGEQQIEKQSEKQSEQPKKPAGMFDYEDEDDESEEGGAYGHREKSPMSPTSQEKLKQLFQACDTNGDGAMSKIEFIKVCRNRPDVAAFFGLPSHIRQEDGSRDMMERVWQRIDTDDDRRITFEELVAVFVGEELEEAILRAKKAPYVQGSMFADEEDDDEDNEEYGFEGEQGMMDQRTNWNAEQDYYGEDYDDYGQIPSKSQASLVNLKHKSYGQITDWEEEEEEELQPMDHEEFYEEEEQFQQGYDSPSALEQHAFIPMEVAGSSIAGHDEHTNMIHEVERVQKTQELFLRSSEQRAADDGNSAFAPELADELHGISEAVVPVQGAPTQALASLSATDTNVSAQAASNANPPVNAIRPDVESVGAVQPMPACAIAAVSEPMPLTAMQSMPTPGIKVAGSESMPLVANQALAAPAAQAASDPFASTASDTFASAPLQPMSKQTSSAVAPIESMSAPISDAPALAQSEGTRTDAGEGPQGEGLQGHMLTQSAGHAAGINLVQATPAAGVHEPMPPASLGHVQSSEMAIGSALAGSPEALLRNVMDHGGDIQRLVNSPSALLLDAVGGDPSSLLSEDQLRRLAEPSSGNAEARHFSNPFVGRPEVAMSSEAAQRRFSAPARVSELATDLDTSNRAMGIGAAPSRPEALDDASSSMPGGSLISSGSRRSNPPRAIEPGQADASSSVASFERGASAQSTTLGARQAADVDAASLEKNPEASDDHKQEVITAQLQEHPEQTVDTAVKKQGALPAPPKKEEEVQSELEASGGLQSETELQMAAMREEIQRLHERTASLESDNRQLLQHLSVMSSFHEHPPDDSGPALQEETAARDDLQPLLSGGAANGESSLPARPLPASSGHRDYPSQPKQSDYSFDPRSRVESQQFLPHGAAPHEEAYAQLAHRRHESSQREPVLGPGVFGAPLVNISFGGTPGDQSRAGISNNETVRPPFPLMHPTHMSQAPNWNGPPMQSMDHTGMWPGLARPSGMEAGAALGGPALTRTMMPGEVAMSAATQGHPFMHHYMPAAAPFQQVAPMPVMHMQQVVPSPAQANPFGQQVMSPPYAATLHERDLQPIPRQTMDSTLLSASSEVSTPMPSQAMELASSILGRRVPQPPGAAAGASELVAALVAAATQQGAHQQQHVDQSDREWVKSAEASLLNAEIGNEMRSQIGSEVRALASELRLAGRALASELQSACETFQSAQKSFLRQSSMPSLSTFAHSHLPSPRHTSSSGMYGRNFSGEDGAGFLYDPGMPTGLGTSEIGSSSFVPGAFPRQHDGHDIMENLPSSAHTAMSPALHLQQVPLEAPTSLPFGANRDGMPIIAGHPMELGSFGASAGRGFSPMDSTSIGASCSVADSSALPKSGLLPGGSRSNGTRSSKGRRAAQPSAQPVQLRAASQTQAEFEKRHGFASKVRKLDTKLEALNARFRSLS